MQMHPKWRRAKSNERENQGTGLEAKETTEARASKESVAHIYCTKCERELYNERGDRAAFIIVIYYMKTKRRTRSEYIVRDKDSERLCMQRDVNHVKNSHSTTSPTYQCFG